MLAPERYPRETESKTRRNKSHAHEIIETQVMWLIEGEKARAGRQRA